MARAPKAPLPSPPRLSTGALLAGLALSACQPPRPAVVPSGSIGAAPAPAPSPAPSPVDHAEACEGGSAQGCIEAGGGHERGDRRLGDFGQALRLYRRACSLGEAEGCRRAASLIERERGLCEQGAADSCHWLEQSWRSLSPTPKELDDVARHQRLLHEGRCERGDREECTAAAVLEADPERSQQMLRQACIGGSRNACRLVRGFDFIRSSIRTTCKSLSLADCRQKWADTELAPFVDVAMRTDPAHM